MAISHLRSVFDAESAFASLRDSPVEIAIVAFLTDDCTLVELYQVAGGVCAVAIDPAEVAVAAVRAGARLAVMAHNHPCGDPSPTRADFALVRRLATALDAVGVRLVDHLVVARERSVSWRQMGLL